MQTSSWVLSFVPMTHPPPCRGRTWYTLFPCPPTPCINGEGYTTWCGGCAGEHIITTTCYTVETMTAVCLVLLSETVQSFRCAQPAPHYTGTSLLMDEKCCGPVVRKYLCPQHRWITYMYVQYITLWRYCTRSATRAVTIVVKAINWKSSIWKASSNVSLPAEEIA